MKSIKNQLLILIFLLFAIKGNSLWLKNIPVLLTQPDGTQIQAYATGDEFHNWVHKVGFKINRNQKK